MGDDQYKHVVGFTRALVAMLIIEGVDSLSLSDTQLLALSDGLLSCFSIKANYKSYESEDKAWEASLRLKFQVSEKRAPKYLQNLLQPSELS